MKHIARTLLIGIISFPTFLHAAEIHGLLEVGEGWLQGYTQIPRGGDYHSTSFHRPTYEEMGLDYNPLIHANASFSHCHGFLFVDYIRLTPHQTFTLSENLLTHSFFIPSGTSMDTYVHYNWYQLGLGYDTQNRFESWQWQFYLAANLLKFHYHFWTPRAKSDRSFNLFDTTIGFNTNKALSPHWKMNIEVDVSLPLTQLTLFNAGIGLSYYYARLMIGALYIDYEDHQNIPNHLRYQLAPYVSIGLGF